MPAGDPICALGSGFGLSGDATTLTTARDITLTAQICDGANTSSIAFYDGATKIGEQSISSGKRSDAQNTYRLYTLSLGLGKAQNSSRSYTAQTTTIAQRGIETSNAVGVTVNIP